MNLRGMGTGSRAIESAADYKANLNAGHFWCTLLTGAHVSSDVALVNGEPRWWRHTTGATAPGGTFDYWSIHAEPMPAVEQWCGDWARQHLAGYTGMVNFETIGGRIIEAHLRFADQWPDLYGAGWVEALIRLYVTGDWDYPDTDRRDGYSVVLFGPHGRAIAIRRRRWWMRCAACRVYRRCRSHSTRNAIPRIMRCRQAVSGWRSSTRIRCRRARPHATHCAIILGSIRSSPR